MWHEQQVGTLTRDVFFLYYYFEGITYSISIPWKYQCEVLWYYPSLADDDSWTLERIANGSYPSGMCRTLQIFCNNKLKKKSIKYIHLLTFTTLTNVHFSSRSVCVCWPVLTIYFHSPVADRAFCGRAYRITLGHIPDGVSSSSSRLCPIMQY